MNSSDLKIHKIDNYDLENPHTILTIYMHLQSKMASKWSKNTCYFGTYRFL